MAVPGPAAMPAPLPLPVVGVDPEAAALAGAAAVAAATVQGDAGQVGSPRHGDEDEAQAVKRPRLIWTGALHKRFLEAVDKCGGVEKCLPKCIMKVGAAPSVVCAGSTWSASRLSGWGTAAGSVSVH